MASIEKVIKGLERIRDYDPMFRVAHDDEFSQYAADALALLKAQEPRVMTLEELDRLQEDDVVFVEIKPVRDLTCISVELVRFVEKAQDPVTWIELHTTDSCGFYMTRKTTDPNWRCWTSRPTDEQREKEPWNG